MCLARGQHRRQRLDLQELLRARGRAACRIAGGGDHCEHRLAEEADRAPRQDWVVVDDRAAVVLAGDVSAAITATTPGSARSASSVDAVRRAMRHRRQAQRGVQRAGELGQVVDVGAAPATCRCADSCAWSRPTASVAVPAGWVKGASVIWSCRLSPVRPWPRRTGRPDAGLGQRSTVRVSSHRRMSNGGHLPAVVGAGAQVGQRREVRSSAAIAACTVASVQGWPTTAASAPRGARDGRRHAAKGEARAGHRVAVELDGQPGKKRRDVAVEALADLVGAQLLPRRGSGTRRAQQSPAASWFFM